MILAYEDIFYVNCLLKTVLCYSCNYTGAPIKSVCKSYIIISDHITQWAIHVIWQQLSDYSAILKPAKIIPNSQGGLNAQVTKQLKATPQNPAVQPQDISVYLGKNNAPHWKKDK